MADLRSSHARCRSDRYGAEKRRRVGPGYIRQPGVEGVEISLMQIQSRYTFAAMRSRLAILLALALVAGCGGTSRPVVRSARPAAPPLGGALPNSTSCVQYLAAGPKQRAAFVNSWPGPRGSMTTALGFGDSTCQAAVRHGYGDTPARHVFTTAAMY